MSETTRTRVSVCVCVCMRVCLCGQIKQWKKQVVLYTTNTTIHHIL